jgi:BTB/POZ domain
VHPSMSATATETPFDISPFDQPKNADVILLSSDEEKFYVRKALLILTSQVFEGMFTLPQKTQEDGEGFEHFPVIKLEDGKAMLYQLLLWCDPRCTPSWKLENIELALSAADKYDIQGVMARISQVLTSTGAFATEDPVKLYAIGIRYGFKELARMAAKEALCLKLEGVPDTPELESISGVALQRLYRYKDECRIAAEKVAREPGWIPELNFVWRQIPLGHCAAVFLGGTYWSSWWVDYMRRAGDELYKRPCGSTIQMGAAFGTEPIVAASGCITCRARCYADLVRFSKLFVDEVERRIAKVSTAR